ncbi:MAG: repeat-associated core domain protein [Gemmataceae bacterium]|nr:repeat-associated core domain protein [Gemmataceae bacterium]
MSLSRWLTRKTHTVRRHRPLLQELLEDRTLMTVQPLTLADPSLNGVSGMLASSAPSISADGQLVAFASDADNLVPNDTNGQPDAFVYDRGTGVVTLVSVGSDGQAAGISGYTSPMAPVISPDGRYVAFESGQSYLNKPIVPGVSGDQIYLRDLSTGTTTLVSVAANGSGGGNGGSKQAVFSADSHHVAFVSSASNLVAGITSNGQYDVYERDLVTGVTTLVSVSLDGKADGNGFSGTTNLTPGLFGLSADGRYVAFQSLAQNLVAVGTGGFEQVYVRDTVAGTTTLVSVAMTGLAAAGGHNQLVPNSQVISADGHYVVFHSNASDLVATPSAGQQESYLRDLRTGTTVLLSASAVDGHAVPSGANYGASEVISPDGRFAAFATGAANVVSLPSSGLNVYVRTLRTGALSLASVNVAGTGGGNGGSGLLATSDDPGSLSFSPNGRYLAFRSKATDLTPGVVTGNRNLYVRDLDAGQTLLVTPNLSGTDGGAGDADTVGPAVFSTDGRYVAFEDTAGNLVPGDNNRDGFGTTANDVFVRDLTAGATALASRRSPLLPAAYTSVGGGTLSSVRHSPAIGDTTLSSVSADGRYVAFTSTVNYAFSDLAPAVTFRSGYSHVFVRDRQTGAIRVVDLDATGKASGGYTPVITPDGRYVAFVGYTNLLPSGIATSGGLEVFVRDLQTNTTSVVSLDPTGAHDAPVDGRELAISADGRYVSWTSFGTLAVAGTTSSSPGNNEMIFLRDRQTGTNYLVSHDPANDGQVRGSSNTLSITSDGRYVAFLSNDPGLTGQGSDTRQVFRWDRTTGQTALVSVNAAGTGPGNNTGDYYGYPPAMTPDGRYIAFASFSTDLTANPTTGGFENVFLRDMGTGTATPSTVLISVNAAGTGAGNSSSISPSVSDDGTVVAFTSDASNLTTDPDLNLSHNVFARDLTTHTTVLVSINAAGTGSATGPRYPASATPILSPNGRYVAFLSDTTDLVPGFVSGSGNSGLDDLYLRDLRQGLTRLVSVNQSGTAGGNADQAGQPFALSGDSGTLFFGSTDSNLYPGDRNGLVTKPANVFAVPTAGYGSISGQVFNDLNANGAPDSGEPGLPYWTVFLDANGNGALDPGEASVMTDAAGRFAFTGLAPGTYRVAVVPQPGYVRTLPATSATYSVTVAADGQALTGKDFGEALPLPDLSTSGVSVSPTSGAPGQSATIAWTVKNQGNAAAAGNWQDAVYLSPTRTLSAASQVLTTVPHEGGLAAGQQYAGSAQAELPPLPGTWYVIVQADRRGQVNEGAFHANKSNNVAASAFTLAITIPQLTLGQPANGQLTTAGPDAYYQLTAPAGRSLVLTVAGVATSGPLELYVKRGALPAPYDFDFAARQAGQSGQVLIVPKTQPGVYYVLVHGVGVTTASAAFTLTATQPGLGLLPPGLTSGGNGGKVTIPVHGTDLTPNSVISLVSGGTVISPVSVDFRDRSLLYATFDLTGYPAGNYSLRVDDGGRSATLPGAFSVTPARGPNLHVHLATPSAIRANTHALHMTVELVVDYSNDGDVDMPAPIFQLTSDLGTLELVSGGALTLVPSITGSGIQFVGTGGDSPGGSLRAGDKGEVKLLLTLPQIVLLGGGGGGGGGTITVGNGSGVTVTLSTLPTDTTPVNWDQFKSQFQSLSVPNDAWDVIWSRFTSGVGSTYGQLQSAVVSDTAYLNQIGVADPSFAQVLAFELLRADAALPVPTLGSSVDVSFPTPGLRLDFGRTFYQSISGRYHSGPLGRGWISNWDISAAVQADGSVLVSDAGFPRLFTRQADGGFTAQPGDHGALTVTNGQVQLREKDGTVMRFRADGRFDNEQDTNGNRITAGYNAAGQLVSLTHSDGSVLSITYNPQGRVNTVTDPSGRVASYAYDTGGEHLLSVTTVRGTTSYTYVTGQTAAAEHALASVTELDGTQTHYTYDAQGRLTGAYRGPAASPIDPMTLTYPSPGGVTFTDASGAGTVLYNQFGQPAVVTDAQGRSTTSTYDASGNLTGIKLPGGLTYAYGYDTRGNLTRLTDPLGQATDFTYSRDLNQLTGYRDAKSNSTGYAHDAQGNLISIAYPDGSRQNFSYDPLGNLIGTVNARGHAVGYTYNAAGQVTKQVFADGSHLDDTYDARANLITAALTDPQGTTTTTTLHYNAADRLIEVDQPGGLFLKFTYDAGGQRTRSVDHTGYTVNYRYDPAGRLVGLTDAGNNQIVTYVYDATGRLSEKDLGNGTYTTYQYDAAGELLHLVNHAPHPAPGQDGPVNSRFDYTYNGRGEVTTETTSDGAWVYSYDADGQLTHAVFTSNNTTVLPNQDLLYAYDAVGNRTSSVINGLTTTYTVNNLNEYTTVDSATYTYDADGNLTSKTDGGVTTTYIFDDLNRLVGVSSSAGTFEYAFDPLGNIASTTQNGQTTQYLNDPTGFGNITGLGTRFGCFANGGTVTHDVYGLGLVSRSEASGSAVYFDFDMLGSAAGITNAVGSYVNRYDYLPFGEATRSTTALPNVSTFVSRYGVSTDGSGLVQMGFRDYDPVTGKFVSNDPLGLLGGDTNLRRYVQNNPLDAIDAAGLGRVFGGDIGKSLVQKTSPYVPFLPRDCLVTRMGSNLTTAVQIGISLSNGDIPEAGANVPSFLPGIGVYHSYWKTVLPELAGAVGRILGSVYFLTHIPFSFSGDPNNLVGPAGFGAPGWINQEPQPLSYSIEFENDPKKATAAAQDVTVTDQLDPNLDWASFQLGLIQFGAIKIRVPDGLKSFKTSVDTTNVDGSPLRVDVSAALDLKTGIVTWVFRSVDPATGLSPLNPVAGFLPVDDNTGRGQGTVNYTVRPKANRASGTVLSAQASIVFDTNAPLNTNTATNTIDADPPTSSVQPLPAQTSGPNFAISWSGSDGAGSGIASYTIYASVDGGAFAPWLTNTTQTSGTYAGAVGHTYGFYSVATDNVGLVQPAPIAAQTTTTIVPPTVPPPPPPATSPVLVGYPQFAIGSDTGGPATVTKYNPDGSVAATLNPFPGTTGGVRTAVADFNGDGIPDVAVGTGPGAVAEVKILDGKTGAVLFDVRPFADFTGGVFVAAGDITGDGKADLIITPDLSGGPRVELYRGGDFVLIANFFGIDDSNFRGGARAAVGDLNGDGFADLVISAGFGGGPRISVYDGKALTNGQQVHLVPDFFLFEPGLRNGAYVAVGDVNGDGQADIIGGGGPGGGPRVLVISGRTLLSSGVGAAMSAPVANFFAGDVANRGGIRVAAKNLDGDKYADVVVGAGTGAGSRVTAYLGKDLAAGSAPADLAFDAFTGFTGGVYVG